MALLEITDLKVHFPIGRGLFRSPQGYVRALDGVSLKIEEGEVVAVVGESGCGKTTLARAILNLVTPTSGEIRLDGREFSKFTPEERKAYRRQVQMVFQDPFDSLNPRKTAFRTLSLPLRMNTLYGRRELRQAAAQLLDEVGLSPGTDFLNRYPHQFSGGQRQRVCIARAIAVRPRLVIADEAVSALDISIRAQILSLLRRLQVERKLSYLFITHDLGVVRSLCNRVVVMYLGQVVEEGETDDVFTRPRHPYTRALLAASPVPDPRQAQQRRKSTILGDVPSPMAPPAGCRFHPRCPFAEQICGSAQPGWTDFPRNHRSCCHFALHAEVWEEAMPI